MLSLSIDQDKSVPFEAWTKEFFLEMGFANGVDKWEAFYKIRFDWLSKYGTLRGNQLIFNGKRISFLSKLKWAFNHIDKLNQKWIRYVC